jgi:ParB family chromosome partitioning protein
MAENSLEIFTRASVMLAEADTIQKTKELRDLALTAADWAKRKGKGEEAVQYARGYALRAERKMGEMLLTTPRAKGTRTIGGDKRSGGTVVLPPEIPEAPTLAAIGITKNMSSTAQSLAKMPAIKFEQVVNGTMSRTKAHVANNSGDNEWYTPDEIASRARAVMGAIDLDPASTEVANKVIKARRIFTPQDDGLSKAWSGRVWMNPPYASDLVGKFSAKLKEHFDAGDISAAIVLVNNSTETQWFQTLCLSASAICFPKTRVRFWHPTKTNAAPLQGQAIIYLGKEKSDFCLRFSDLGICAYVVRSKS